MKLRPLWIVAMVALTVTLLSSWLTAQDAKRMTIRTDGLEFPDGTIQQTAAAADPRKSYYATETTHLGSDAQSACASGYHMAALYEMLDEKWDPISVPPR